MENIQKKSYKYFLIACWVLVLGISLGRGTAGSIEGYFFPVVSEMSISSVKDTEVGSVITGNFIKLRNCDYEGIDWYLYNQENSLRTKLTVISKESKVFQRGEEVERKIFLNTPSENVEDSIAFTNHKCHPLFDTITKVYGE